MRSLHLRSLHYVARLRCARRRERFVENSESPRCDSRREPIRSTEKLGNSRCELFFFFFLWFVFEIGRVPAYFTRFRTRIRARSVPDLIRKTSVVLTPRTDRVFSFDIFFYCTHIADSAFTLSPQSPLSLAQLSPHFRPKTL